MVTDAPESDQKDDRFGSIISKHFKNSPDQKVRVGKPSKAALKQVPRHVQQNISSVAANPITLKHSCTQSICIV